MGEGVLTPPSSVAGFHWNAGTLTCEQVPVPLIADRVGTPVYVYSNAFTREQYIRLDRALAPVPHRVHYSVKANSNYALLSLLRELGAGVDIVSGGELYRSLRAGFRGCDIVFSGVGKTRAELQQALGAGVLLVNVESEGELRLLAEIAAERGIRAPVALRVNPEVTVETPHPYTRTGERGQKFGIPYDEAPAVAQLALTMSSIELLGLDMHIGSQVAQLDPYEQGTLRLLELHAQLREQGASTLRYLDIGGGLAVTYDRESATNLDAFADAVLPLVAVSGLTLILEPGRFLVGNGGALITRVLYRKRSGGREYVITDAGMTDLLRPSHYNAFHAVEPVIARGETQLSADIVGPVCESGDFFALGRSMADVAPGDLLAIRSAGAYGHVMASNYNSRPRPPEVLVDGSRFAVVGMRESHEDLVRHEPTVFDWRTA